MQMLCNGQQTNNATCYTHTATFYKKSVALAMPTPTTGGGGIVFKSYVRPSTVRPLTTILQVSRDVISLYLVERISIKLGTSIHHVSGHC